MDAKMFEISIGEGNVAGVHVDHVNSEGLELPQNGLRVRPSRAELLLLLGSPVRENFLRKLRCLVQVRTREVQYERSSHNRHFDDGKIVVEVQKNGNVGTENLCDFELLESQISVAFSKVANTL